MRTNYVGNHRWECDAELQAVAVDLREDVRLVLQYHLDFQPYIDADGTSGNGGGVSGYDAAQEYAIRHGWLSRFAPEDADGKRCSGVLRTVLNHEGAIVLREANAARGDKATRLVWGIKYFGASTKPVHAGGPFIVPLSKSVEHRDHGVYTEVDWNLNQVPNQAPRKTFLERILG